jgi:4-carboxymuconolactone decarboxylase
MARIKLYPTDDMSADQRAVHQAIISGSRGKIVGPLRAALHNAELADKWQQLGELLRFRTSLPPRWSELAILITARHWDSQFEWYQHEPIARKAGLADAVISEIAAGNEPPLTAPDDKAVARYASELLRNHRVSQVTYQAALDLLQEKALVELTALIGYYSMVALTLNAHEFDLPAGTAAPLPPLSRGLR